MVKIKKNKGFTIFLLSLIVLAMCSVFVSAITASIGNARMVLYPKVVPGEPTIIEKSIAVNNINDVDVEIELKSSEEFEQYVNIIDDSFVLKPTEYKNARFNINITQPGRYEGKIFVTFLPVDESNSSGVGLASNILIIAKETEEDNLKNMSSEINASQLNEQNQESQHDLSMIITILIILGILIVILSLMFYKKFRGKIK